MSLHVVTCLRGRDGVLKTRAHPTMPRRGAHPKQLACSTSARVMRPTLLPRHGGTASPWPTCAPPAITACAAAAQTASRRGMWSRNTREAHCITPQRIGAAAVPHFSRFLLAVAGAACARAVSLSAIPRDLRRHGRVVGAPPCRRQPARPTWRRAARRVCCTTERAQCRGLHASAATTRLPRAHQRRSSSSTGAAHGALAVRLCA